MIEATVLFGDKHKDKMDAMRQALSGRMVTTVVNGLGFWKGEPEPAVRATFDSWGAALNAAQAIRAAGEQEAVLVILYARTVTYGLLVTASGFENLGCGYIRDGLSDDGSGFCDPETAECWHFG